MEFDVRRAGDGTLVVCHDETVDRTTDGSGPVDELTAADLAALDAGEGEGEGIPTVAEVLELLAPTDVALQVELTERGLAADVLTQLGERGLRDRAVLTSFDDRILEAVEDTRVERALLSSTLDADVLDRATSLGVEYVCTRVAHASPTATERARDRGLAVGFWGVNEPEDVRAALDAGAGVISTDRPDRVTRLFRQRDSD